MSHRAKKTTLQIWIAMLAILFSALAPTVSRAMAAAAPGAYAEICSMDGVKTVAIQSGGDARKIPGPAMQDMDHCAYCLLHGHTPALPSTTVASFAVVGGHDLYPALYYQAPQPLHSWQAASPRGPPALS